MANPVLITANRSKIMIEGEEVPGAQYIDYEVNRNRQNIHAISNDERVGAYFGGVFVQGVLKVRSAFFPLDKAMYDVVEKLAHFQMVMECPAQGSDQTVKKVTFDECYLEKKKFEMDATGVAVSTYYFTSTRIREEDGSSSVQSTGPPANQ